MVKYISGIYKIFNIDNGKCYIGSSVDVGYRFKKHIICLNKNIHHSKYLQSSWNKYGSKSFRFEIIEEILDKTKLINREQYWIDTLKPEFNSLPCARGFSIGYTPWNKGLSKDTNIILKKMSDDSKDRIPWNKGLTKDIDPRVIHEHKDTCTCCYCKNKSGKLRDPITEKTRKKLSISQIRRFQEKGITAVTRRRMSIAQTERQEREHRIGIS
jgi:group I intron endonuclease